MASQPYLVTHNTQLVLATAILATPLLMYTIKNFASQLWSAQPEVPKKTRIVLGGGWTGLLAARHLSSQLDPRKYELILINERPYMINYIASARMTVTTVDDLASEEKALVLFDKLFYNGKGRLVIGRAIAVEEDKGNGSGDAWVVLESGEKIRWDALVVATGCSWQGPLDSPGADALPAHVKRWQEDVQAANGIYVVGGGPAGIEFAAEIKEEYPDKKVTIVHGGAKLLTSAYPDKHREDVERKCRARGIGFVFNERVDHYPERGTHGLTTRKGTHFESRDLAIPAFGSRPNATTLASLSPSPIAESGVMVNPSMEVQGHRGIFALGDVVDAGERKQAAKGQAHLRVVVPNVVSFVEGRPLRKEYRGVPEMIVIPFGKTGGSGYLDVLWGIMVGDWVDCGQGYVRLSREEGPWSMKKYMPHRAVASLNAL